MKFRNKIKRAISLMLAVVMAVSTLAMSVSAETLSETLSATASLTASSTVVEAGQTIDIALSLSDAAPISFADFDLSYPEGFTLQSISYNSELGGTSYDCVAEGNTGSPLTVSWFTLENIELTDYTFATLTFVANDNITAGTKTFTAKYVDAGNSDIETVYINNSTVSIQALVSDNENVDLSSTATLTASATEVAAGDTLDVTLSLSDASPMSFAEFKLSYPAGFTLQSISYNPQLGGNTYDCVAEGNTGSPLTVSWFTLNNITLTDYEFATLTFVANENITAGTKTFTVNCSDAGTSAFDTVAINEASVSVDAISDIEESGLTTATLTASATEVAAGDTLDVTLSLSDAAPMSFAEFKLSYPAGFTLQSISYNSQLGGNTYDCVAEGNTGSPLTVSWFTLNNITLTDYEFATLTFVANDNITAGAKTFAVKYVDAGNSAFDTVLINDVSVSVEATSDIAENPVTTATLTASASEVAVGDTFDVTLSLSDASPMSFAEFKLSYPAGFTLQSISYNSQLGGTSYDCVAEGNTGSPLTVSWFTLNNITLTDYEFATLTFVANASATAGTKTFSVTCTDAGTSAFDVIEINDASVDVVVEEEQPPVESGSATATLTASSSTIKAGDTVDVTLSLSDASPLAFGDFRLAYPEGFTVKAVEYSDLIIESSHLYNNPVDGGVTASPLFLSFICKIDSTTHDSINITETDYEVVTVTFEANEDVSLGTKTFAFTCVDAAYSDYSTPSVTDLIDVVINDASVDVVVVEEEQPPVESGSATATLTASSSTIKAGDTVSLTIDISDADPVSGIDMDFEYPEGFTFTGVTYNSDLGGMSNDPIAGGNTSSPLSISWFALNDITLTDYEFATLTFVANEDITTGTKTFTAKYVDACDSAFNTVEINDASVDVVVEEEQPPVESDSATATLTASSSTIKAGDTVSLTIDISDADPMSFAEFKFSYPAGFTLTNVEYNPALGGMSNDPIVGGNTSSPLSISWFTINDITLTDYEFATLTFVANDDVTLGRKTFVATYADAGNADFETVAINNASATIEVVESSIDVTGVTLDKTTLYLGLGNSFTLTSTITPNDATDKSVTWASSNTDAVTVDADGKITAVGAGSATITVKTVDGGYTAECVVTVTVPVTGVVLFGGAEEASMSKGDTSIPILVEVLPAEADNKEVTYESLDPTIATIDNTGCITALAVGTATIKVTTVDGGFTDTIKIIVVVPETGISLNQPTLDLDLGNSVTLTPTFTPLDATNRDVTWESSNEAAVTVDTNGKITAVGDGSATITVTSKLGYTAECVVTVVVPVTGVTLDKTTLDLEKGATSTLTATVLPSDATNKSVTWTSSDKSVATVDANGKVTAVAEGIASITVKTADGNFTDTCSVEVYDPALAIDSINFPDEIFRDYISKNFDLNSNSYLSAVEIAAVTDIDVSQMGISDLKGIEFFTSLKNLWCFSNRITTLDVSKNTKLAQLYVYLNDLSTLDVSKNTELVILDCSNNSLTSLDVSKNTKLKRLDCAANDLTALNVTANTALSELYCQANSIKTLDVSKNTSLTKLYCASNALETLDVSKNTQLSVLHCPYNSLTSLDVSKNTKLQELNCSGNYMLSIDVSKNTALKLFECYDNKRVIVDDNVTEIDLSQYPEIDLSKASEWKGCTYDAKNNKLVALVSDEISFKYDCQNGYSAKFMFLVEGFVFTINNGDYSIEVNEKETPIKNSMQLVVEEIIKTPVVEKVEELIEEVSAAAEEVTVFDINVVDALKNVVSIVDTEIEIAIPATNGENTAYYFNGEELVKVVSRVANGFIYIKTNHLSMYVIAKEEVTKMPGDVNSDGKVNIRDVVLLYQYTSRWPVTIDTEVANVNADAGINIRDVVLLYQYTSKWPVVIW